MKKALTILICIFLLVGCGKDKEKQKQGETEHTINLENKLIEYGKIIYEKDYWLKGGIEPGNYYTTLSRMNETYGLDISMFTNEKTKSPCDTEKTRIEFIVTSKKDDKKTVYKFKPVLSC